jgi:hypothetical protein
LRLAGTVVAAYGRQYRIELADGTTLLCVPRGKKSELVCGDRVTVQRTSPDQGVIGALDTRRTLLYRSDNFKQKLIAANVTQVIIVVATEPSFSDELITRCIVAAESQDIQVLIVLNKCDLSERLAAATAALAPYEKLGLPDRQAFGTPEWYAAVTVSGRPHQPADRPIRDGQIDLDQCPGPWRRRTNPRDLASPAHRQTHHHACQPLPPKRRLGADRLARPDRIWSTPPVIRGNCARVYRTSAAARPLSLPQLSTRP